MYSVFEKLLKEKGVTAYKVAKDTGVTTATLSSWKTLDFRHKSLYYWCPIVYYIIIKNDTGGTRK